MMKPNVVSREYKIILNNKLFAGSEAKLLEKSQEFWHSFKDLIKDIVLDIDGNLNEIEKRRSVRFYDCKDNRLYNNHYVFRERVDNDSKEREVMLKYRHPDRYISQDRNMAASVVENGKTKLEEDIKPPFNKLYSFSTKQLIKKDQNLNQLKSLNELYPDLKKQLESYKGSEPIEIVGNFTAKEVVISGVDLQIGESPKLDAKCSLVAWYDAAKETNQPLIVEFSFKYENKHEKFDGTTSQRAYDIYERLKHELENWIDPEGQTKTAYVYSRQ